MNETHGESHPTAVAESVPPEWEDVVRALKDKGDVDNPWAVVNSMIAKGYKRSNEAGAPYSLDNLLRRHSYDLNRSRIKEDPVAEADACECGAMECDMRESMGGTALGGLMRKGAQESDTPDVPRETARLIREAAAHPFVRKAVIEALARFEVREGWRIGGIPAEWEEEEHPRGEGGKFAPKGEGDKGSAQSEQGASPVSQEDPAAKQPGSPSQGKADTPKPVSPWQRPGKVAKQDADKWRHQGGEFMSIRDFDPKMEAKHAALNAGLMVALAPAANEGYAIIGRALGQAVQGLGAGVGQAGAGTFGQILNKVGTGIFRQSQTFGTVPIIGMRSPGLIRAVSLGFSSVLPFIHNKLVERRQRGYPAGPIDWALETALWGSRLGAASGSFKIAAMAAVIAGAKTARSVLMNRGKRGQVVANIGNNPPKWIPKRDKDQWGYAAQTRGPRNYGEATNAYRDVLKKGRVQGFKGPIKKPGLFHGPETAGLFPKPWAKDEGKTPPWKKAKEAEGGSPKLSALIEQLNQIEEVDGRGQAAAMLMREFGYDLSKNPQALWTRLKYDLTRYCSEMDKMAAQAAQSQPAQEAGFGGDWEEEEHPRAEDGKFTSKGGGAASTSKDEPSPDDVPDDPKAAKDKLEKLWQEEYGEEATKQEATPAGRTLDDMRKDDEEVLGPKEGAEKKQSPQRPGYKPGGLRIIPNYADPGSPGEMMGLPALPKTNGNGRSSKVEFDQKQREQDLYPEAYKKLQSMTPENQQIETERLRVKYGKKLGIPRRAGLSYYAAALAHEMAEKEHKDLIKQAHFTLPGSIKDFARDFSKRPGHAVKFYGPRIAKAAVNSVLSIGGSVGERIKRALNSEKGRTLIIGTAIAATVGLLGYYGTHGRIPRPSDFSNWRQMVSGIGAEVGSVLMTATFGSITAGKDMSAIGSDVGRRLGGKLAEKFRIKPQEKKDIDPYEAWGEIRSEVEKESGQQGVRGLGDEIAAKLKQAYTPAKTEVPAPEPDIPLTAQPEEEEKPYVVQKVKRSRKKGKESADPWTDVKAFLAAQQLPEQLADEMVRRGYRRVSESGVPYAPENLVRRVQYETVLDRCIRGPVRETVNLTVREAARPEKAGPLGPLPVVLMTSGFGNKNLRNFYPESTIARSAQFFDGVKCFLNHQGAQEEIDRPERDVRDVCGWFSRPRLEIVENGQALVADLHFTQNTAGKEARELIASDAAYRTEHPDKVLVGFSVNGSGPSHSEIMDGENWNVIEVIDQVMSADLVTFPARGGKVLESKEVAQWAA